MANELKNAADAILNGTVTGSRRVPGWSRWRPTDVATSTRARLASGSSARTRT